MGGGGGSSIILQDDYWIGLGGEGIRVNLCSFARTRDVEDDFDWS